MDESDNDRRDNIPNFVSNLSTPSSRCIIKILIASRPENHIRPWMTRASRIVLEKVNAEDIKAVVKSGINEIERLTTPVECSVAAATQSYGEQNIFSEAEEYILENSAGVFLWVTLILRELKQCVIDGAYSLNDIADCVRCLPKDLGGPDGFYRAMITRMIDRHGINGRNQARGRRIFAWVTFSARPLLLSELDDALATPVDLKEDDISHFDLSRTRHFDFGRGLASFCGGLVEVSFLIFPLQTNQ